MLAPDTRTLYTECLQAPVGYRFHSGVATTFTIDLETLLVLPFTLLTQKANDPEDLLSDPVKLIEGVRETTSDFTVFFNHGRIHAPTEQRILFSMLEDCIAPVLAPSGRGVFHPKLWLLRFVNEAGSPLLRALVLSRNLTFDRSWDTVLCLEGEPWGRAVPQSRGLSDLLRALPGMCVQGLDRSRATALANLADEAGRTPFRSPPGFSDERPVFHAIGLDGRDWKPDVSGNRLLVVSPFVSSHMPVRLAQMTHGERTILASEDQLNDIRESALDSWEAFVLEDAADASAEMGDDEHQADEDAGTRCMSGLHAKLIAVERGKRTHWWIGSANFTGPAWSGSNVELMVELEGTRKNCGIDLFWESGFADLRRPYERSEPNPDQEARKKAEQEAERVRDAIAAADLALACSGAETSWNIELRGTVGACGETTVVTWPVTLREAAFARDATALCRGEPVTWAGVAPASITSIVAFAVTARHESAKATVRFALKLPHTGFPEDRHAQVLRQIINSSSGFFRYLKQLLGDGTGGAAELLESIEPVVRGGAWNWSATLGDEVLLESLVRAASREPERLERIDRLVADLTRDQSEEQLIPADFIALWQAVRQFASSRGGKR